MKPSELARALRRLRLSQVEAARRLEVHPTTVWRWLAGRRTIPGPASAAVRSWLEHSDPREAA